MTKYGYTVDALNLVGGVAKTLIELQTPASTEATVYQWHVEFDNTTANTPVRVELQLFGSAVTTATTVTPVRNGNGGGTSACTLRHSTTVEGSSVPLTGSGEIHRISPTTGIVQMYPLGREQIIPISSVLRIRALAAVGVSASFALFWEE